VFNSKSENDTLKTATRRAFLIGSGAAAIALVWGRFHRYDNDAAEAAPRDLPNTVTIVQFNDQGQRTGQVTVPRLQKTEGEWRKQLSSASFDVTRREGTERPYTGANLNIHDKGIFRCICCDTALFDSQTKFESGTGWPSFWAPIAKENVLETKDSSLGMVRVQVSCRLCNAHLGHVFDDGPQPTGLRYCMNSVALRFAKA
jgi:peptide-methionine (R)-S-oxide reductase